MHPEPQLVHEAVGDQLACELAAQPQPSRLCLNGAAAIGGFGGWATTSELSGAVIAPGIIVVEFDVKKVQHPTGGIVAEIPVKEGSAVEEGRIVMRLNVQKREPRSACSYLNPMYFWRRRRDLLPSVTALRTLLFPTSC